MVVAWDLPYCRGNLNALAMAVACDFAILPAMGTLNTSEKPKYLRIAG